MVYSSIVEFHNDPCPARRAALVVNADTDKIQWMPYFVWTAGAGLPFRRPPAAACSS